MQKHTILIEGATHKELMSDLKAVAEAYGVVTTGAAPVELAEKHVEPPAEKPKAEDKPKTKPAKKAPAKKAEEPKAEEPKAEEPKAEEPKAEEPKAGEPKAGEPKAGEPKAEEPKAEELEEKVELSDVRAAVQQYAAEHGNPKGKALVSAFGAGKVSEVPEEFYGAFVKACGMKPADAEKYAAGFASAGA